MSFLFALILAAATPCPAEDSTGCYWDAGTRGNGIGTSFVTVGPESHRFTIRFGMEGGTR